MRISVQLYTIRDHMAKDFDGTLSALAAIGLRTAELAGLHGRTPIQAKAVFERVGIQPIGTHVGIERLREDFDGLVAETRELGIEYVVVPWVAQQEYASGWDRFGQVMSEFGRRLADVGLRLLYHNHSFEFERQGDKEGLAVLFDTTDSSDLGAELDLYWVQHAGHDPVAWLRKLASRVPLAHYKDGFPGTNRMVEVGAGVLNWDAIIEASREAGLQYAIIELDESPRDSMDCVAASFAYLRSKGLAV